MSVQTATSYFHQDHERLDGLLDQFQALKACDYAEAKHAASHPVRMRLSTWFGSPETAMHLLDNGGGRR